MNVNKLHRYLIGAALFIGYTLFALSWKAGDIVIVSHGYDNNELGTLTGVLNIVKLSVNFLVALLVAKYTTEKLYIKNSQLLATGFALCAVSLVGMTFSDNFYVLAGMRAVLGFGGAFILFTMNPIISQVFPKDELPVINGLNASAFNLGIAITLTVSGAIVASQTFSLYIVAGALLVAMILFFLGNLSPLSQVKLQDRLNSTKPTDQAAQSNSESGFVDALKSKFNWLFCITFTGVIAFYYVAFTFLDPDTVKYMLYAGIFGNAVGIIAAQKFNHLTVSRICALVQFVAAIGFMLFIDQPVGKYIAIILGFSIFLSLPSYMTLAFTQKGATPQRIGMTFMLLWVVSDLAATFILKIYAYLESSASGTHTAALFILAIDAVFLIGCLIMKNEAEEVSSESNALAAEN